ncbi:hypothetical protein [Paenibacillus hubeiensis]|uniref:hypothetical protein n=1 Tax=Paenibacillus hubeiensis TaxID=3077330 RepID=UPI0031B9EDE9
MTFDKKRELLQTLLTPSGTISITPLYDDGLQLFLRVKQQGLECIVQYNSDAPYFLNARPKDVITKIKVYQYVTCQVSATRKGVFGWGLQMDGKYVGIVEFPPHRNILSKFHYELKKLVRNDLEPVLSCKVRFQCFTKDGKLRSPIIEELVDWTVA